MKYFKNLDIWQFGFQIANNCFEIVETFPGSEKWGLAIQITKAGVSIPSNVAEGSTRSSEKDYNRFIEIALGSAFELETQLLLSKARKLGKQDFIEKTLELLDREQKMLISFSAILQKKPFNRKS
ncbi:MAG: four helix bundle protein [Bacteroidota bacterium]|nr:four helix bundle protein [Bacteroidota bacterium]